MNKDTQILIVGLGLLGASYAKGLTEEGFKVNAIEINAHSLDFAMQKQWIQQGSTMPNPEIIESADLIVFGLYPEMVLPWLKENQKWFKKGAIITDVTGVKTGIVEEVQAILKADCEFVGSHPMAGKEVSGAQYADNQIFKQANFIITPTKKNTEQAINTIRELAECLKFHHIVCLSIEEHDKMIGFVSQLTHVIAVTLMNTNDNTHLVEYTGDSFRDLTRIAKINEHLWTELFLLNKVNLLQEISDFQNELEHFKQVLNDENVEEMKRLFCQSTERRKRFDR